MWMRGDKYDYLLDSCTMIAFVARCWFRSTEELVEQEMHRMHRILIRGIGWVRYS